ncbi:MAG: PAS domain S-box protein [Gemmatimonadota bacterium]|nr:PAS domain S-box protein [Gemmatimonadota bacterium]
MSSVSPSKAARRIAFWIYVPVAMAWILGTDLVVALYSGSADAWLLGMNMLKGAGFALVTGVLLYWLLRREIERREARARDHRTLTENVPDLVFRLQVRPELAFEYVSPSSVDIAGYTPDEHYESPETVFAAVHPEDREGLDRLLTDVDSGLEETELRWCHKDGRVVWTEIRVRKERDTEGSVLRLSGVVRDVTQRREAERFQALLASALDAAGEAVLITDVDGVIQYVNPAFTSITLYPAEEAIGSTPRILQSGEQDEAFYRDLWRTIEAGRMFRGVMVNRRKDGHLYEQETSITPVRDAQGDIEYFIAVARDITVQHALERRLRFTEKMDAMGQLAAGVAHDFRNLLNVILVNAEFLSTRALPSGARGAESDGEDAGEVEEILTAARRGSGLVARLLGVARQPDVELRATDLEELLDDMRGILRASLLESVELDVRVGPGPVVVHADPDLLQDALINLVQNAGHAMPSGGRVVIEVSSDKRDGEGDGAAADGAPVRISVRDTGIGMDDATLERLFDPFFTTKETGTGLGLPMVRTIVERHGGSIEVESAQGQGTTISLVLPPASAATEAVGDAPAEEAVDEGSHGDAADGAGRILLAEDDARLRGAAERALRRLGHQVQSVENGRTAFSRIEAAPEEWDLVITDLIMPELGGTELYELVRQRGWDMPFLFMSGHAPEAVSSVERAGGRHTFLEKPWTLEGLATRVREAMQDRRDSRPA